MEQVAIQAVLYQYFSYRQERMFNILGNVQKTTKISKLHVLKSRIHAKFSWYWHGIKFWYQDFKKNLRAWYMFWRV